MERIRSRIHFSHQDLGPDLNFWEKAGFDMNGMVNKELCNSMAEMGTEPDPKSKIWRLTGSEFGVLVFGSGIGVNFLTPPISGGQPLLLK